MWWGSTDHSSQGKKVIGATKFGWNNTDSFLSFCSNEISSNIDKLGIVFNDTNVCVNEVIDDIRFLEHTRLTEFHAGNSKRGDLHNKDIELLGEQNIDNLALGNLCSGIM